MLRLTTSGTLGDTWITCLKLLATLKEPVEIYHAVEGWSPSAEWQQAIREIYHLVPQVTRVHFTDSLADYPRVYSRSSTELDPPGTQIAFFPGLVASIPPTTVAREVNRPYLAIICNSGKSPGEGSNTKILPPRRVQDWVEEAADHSAAAVLLGTLPDLHGNIRTQYNLVGKTGLLDAIFLAGQAGELIAPEGLLAFVALSSRVRSTIFYTDYTAVAVRIVGTPWEEYARLLPAEVEQDGILKV